MSVATGLKCHPDGIIGAGNPAAKVVVVGIAPGQQEVKHGTPFVGPAGNLLNQILASVGWSRDQVYCTNLICTFDNSPSQAQIDACAPRLRQEILSLHPKLIVILGSIPAQQFIGQPIGKCRGKLRWSPEWQAYLLPTYHPAAILRGSHHLSADLVRDLWKIRDVIDLYPDVPLGLQGVDYRRITDRAEAQQYLAALEQDDIVAVDIETSTRPTSADDPDPFGGDLICVGMSSSLGNVVFSPGALDGAKWPKGIRWTFHNGMSDYQALKKYLGVEVPIVEDTLLMSYTIDERTTGIHGLQGLAQEWCLTGPYKCYDTTEHIIETNAYDVQYTRRLWYILRRKQEAEDVLDLYYNLLIPAANVFAEISYGGIKIDIEALGQVAARWDDDRERLEAKLIKLSNDAGWHASKKINLNSPQQVSRLLYDIMCLPHPNGRSTDRKTLQAISHLHEFVAGLIEYRTLVKMIGTYGLGVFDDIKPDGCVHPSVLLHGAGTGRTSYKNPPMQTIPSAMAEKFVQIRRIVVPKCADTHCIVDADLSQAEIWVGYGYSRDANMLADLQHDIHRQVTKQIFALTDQALDALDPLEAKARRTESKHVTFGRMYLREAKALAENELKCSIAEAAVFVSKWNRRYAGYIEWTKQILKQLMRTGEIVSITGRKRRFYTNRDYNSLRQAVNHPIQGTSGDIKLAALLELHERLKPLDSRVLFEVHDSIVFEASKAHLDEVLALIKECMSRPRWGFPSIPVEVAVGPNLFDVKKVKA